MNTILMRLHKRCYKDPHGGNQQHTQSELRYQSHLKLIPIRLSVQAWEEGGKGSWHQSAFPRRDRMDFQKMLDSFDQLRDGLFWPA